MPATQRANNDRSSRPGTLFALEAQRLLVVGDARRAVELCKRGLAYHPENPTGYVVLAQAYIQLDEKERALNVLRDGYRRTSSDRLNRLALELSGEISSIVGDIEGDESQVAEAEPAPEVEPAPEAEPAVGNGLAPESAFETAPEATSELAPEPEILSTPATTPEPEPAVEPAPESDSMLATEPIPASGVGSDMNGTEMHSISASEHLSPVAEESSAVEISGDVEEPEVMAQISAEPEIITEPEIVAEPEIITEPEIIAEPEIIDGSEILAEPAPATEAEEPVASNLTDPVADVQGAATEPADSPEPILVQETPAEISVLQPEENIEAAEVKTIAPSTPENTQPEERTLLTETPLAVEPSPVAESQPIAEHSTVAEPLIAEPSPVKESSPVAEPSSVEEPQPIEESATIEESSTIDPIAPPIQEGSRPREPRRSPGRSATVMPLGGAGRAPVQQVTDAGRQMPIRTIEGRSAMDMEPAQGTPLERQRPLALHLGKNISRLRSSNLRLIPGLEFAPLRHEDNLRRQSIAPLINEPMPMPMAEPSLRSQKGVEEKMMPPLPALGNEASRQEELQFAEWEEKKTAATIHPHAEDVAEPLPHVIDEEPEPEMEDEPLPFNGNILQMVQSGRIEAELTPLEELARRLETARIPVVEEPEQRPVFQPSLVSETLANILVSQGAYAEALKAFQTLARQKPEQFDHFQQRIREMKWRLQNPNRPWPPQEESPEQGGE